MRTLLFAAAAVLLFSHPLSSGAVTVQFGDADRAPGDMLQIGGITISAYQPPTVFQPSTTLGQGLGVAGPVGASYSFDQQLQYLAGEQYPSTTLKEDRIHFSLDSIDPRTFTSMTIVPYLTISGSGGPYSNMVPDGFSVFVGLPYTGGGGEQILPAAFGLPTVIDLPYQSFLNNGLRIDSLDLFLSSGMGGPDEGIFFSDYRLNHLAEEQTIQFGFTLVSLDFEPVPEPSSFALIGLGALLWGWLNRRK